MSRHDQNQIVLGFKTQSRQLVTEGNSTVSPGNWQGLNFETARARPGVPVTDGPPRIMARCTFESGHRRPVSVWPRTKAGDVFWLRETRKQKRRESILTLVVTEVQVARVQDISGNQCLDEGIDPGAVWARTAFAKAWDAAHGRGSWAANPWVWIYAFIHHCQNVDALLAQRND